MVLIKGKKMADLQGFEPRQSEPESLVLPLHHRSALWHIIYHEFAELQVKFLKKIKFFSTKSVKKLSSFQNFVNVPNPVFTTWRLSAKIFLIL